jgi:hypothetical protein
MQTLLLFFFVIFLSQTVRGDVEVLSPAALTGTYQAASIFLPGSEHYYSPITAELALNSSTSKAGKIILLAGSFPFEPLYRSAQAAGALGVLLSSIGEPGYAMYTLDGSNTNNITIAISQMTATGYSTIQSSLSNGSFSNITIVLSVGDNKWTDANSSVLMIVWQVVLGVYTLLVVALCIHRLAIFIRVSSTWRAYLLPKVVISMLLIANLERVVFVSVDPFSLRQILSYPASRILLTASLPVSMSAAVLLLFYWHEQISYMNVRVTNFISKLKIPAAIVIALLISFEIVADILKALSPTTYSAVTKLSAVYLVITLPIGVFYLVTALKVIYVTKKIGKHSNKNKGVRKLTVKLLIAGVIQALIAVPNILIILLLTSNPVVAYLIVFFIIIGFDTIDLLETLSFVVSKRQNSSRGSHCNENLSRKTPKVEVPLEKKEDSKDERECSHKEVSSKEMTHSNSNNDDSKEEISLSAKSANSLSVSTPSKHEASSTHSNNAKEDSKT